MFTARSGRHSFFRSLTCALLFASGMFCLLFGNWSAGKLNTTPLYYQSDVSRLDTLYWSNVVDSALPDSCTQFAATVQYLAESNRKLIQVEECTALCAAILADRGYTPIALTQWIFLPTGYINLNTAGSSGEYDRQRIVSPYLWERLVTIDVARPTGIQQDYTVSISFSGVGRTTYAGEDLLSVKSNPLELIREDFTLQFAGGRSQKPKGYRKIYDCYLLVPEETEIDNILSEVEKVMDEIGLDLSHRPPVLFPVNP